MGHIHCTSKGTIQGISTIWKAAYSWRMAIIGQWLQGILLILISISIRIMLLKNHSLMLTLYRIKRCFPRLGKMYTRARCSLSRIGWIRDPSYQGKLERRALGPIKEWMNSTIPIIWKAIAFKMLTWMLNYSTIKKLRCRDNKFPFLYQSIRRVMR